MLQRIEKIKNVGLFRDVSGARFSFKKATLIYGENGRGKSTLASIFRAISSADADAITSRRTIDTQDEPDISAQFANGHKVTFQNGAWSEARPELVVYDAEFVDKNVHSGGVVSTNHRKNLLEFALGEKAVAARLLVEKTTSDAAKASAALKVLTNKLEGHHPGITLAAFEKLQKREDIEELIQASIKKLADAGNAATILKKPAPSQIATPDFDIPALFQILATSIEGIEDDAERQVRSHIEHVSKPGVEAWLSEGNRLASESECPFCGQGLEGIQLIKAYRTYFNQAYSELKAKVSKLQRGVDLRCSDEVANSLTRAVEAINENLLGWADHKKLDPIAWDKASVAEAIVQLRELLTPLVTKKTGAPSENVVIGNLQDEAQTIWSRVTIAVAAVNSAVIQRQEALRVYKESLTAENLELLQKSLKALEITRNRFTPPVEDLFAQLKDERVKSAKSEAEKKDAREQLTQLMAVTLGQYEQDINKLLGKFGASFSIASMSTNYRGAAPRTEYFIKLRGKDVSPDGVPSFSTALSEGDKRTLAFAFFVASCMQDPDLATKVVVIDDPMCSFDLNRKEQTRLILRTLYGFSQQIVVLAHDIYFMRDLHQAISKADTVTNIACFQIKYAALGYSTFLDVDFSAECEGVYYRNHRQLKECVEGSIPDSRLIARAIRPFMEGYLHRRFPGLIPQGLMFGQVIAYIDQADPTNPIASAKILTSELGEINEYAGQFHHDTNQGNCDTIPVVESELVAYAQRALKLVYSGSN